MKGQRFHRRLRFALAGLRAIRRTEASFRTQLWLAGAAAAAMVALRPAAVWVALVVLAIGFVLAAEAFNAAIEHVADALHPEHHPLIGIAKDAAAGGVLLASLALLCVALTVTWSFMAQV